MYKKNYNSDCCLYGGALIVFIIIFLSFGVYADDFTGLKNGDFWEKSVIRRDRVVIKDKNFKTKGYLEPSVIDPRKTILYDADGNSKGYFQKDVIDNRKIRFHQTGESKNDGALTTDHNKGYLQRSVIDSRKTILYDTDGNAKGYFRTDVIDSRQFRFHQKK
ncbi:MAG: hypothetical protein OET63_17765 [Desulfobacterales bacterium]|jgi:hypothetical protein|nr:hypothetical protein [Desulfobacterales bacterium]